MESAISELVSYKTGLVIMLTCNKLITLYVAWSDFGTLLMGNQDWDNTFIWKTSMKLLAKAVMLKISQHVHAAAY